MEVLIAMLIMAIGLLGVAALQATALRNSQSSYERTQAAVLTYAIFDAMRANRGNASAYATTKLCDPGKGGTLAANDLAAWISNAKTSLGAGTCGTVGYIAATDEWSAELVWNDTRGTGGSDEQSFKVVTKL